MRPTDLQRAYLGGDGASSGSINVQRVQQFTMLSEPGFYGTFERTAVYGVTPNASVGEPYIWHTVDMTGSGDPFHHWRTYPVVLTSGRGFSRYLDEVIAVEARPDGLLWCKAKGNRFPRILLFGKSLQK